MSGLSSKTHLLVAFIDRQSHDSRNQLSSSSYFTKPGRVRDDTSAIGIACSSRKDDLEGQLTWEKKEPRPSEDRGSNNLRLVAGTGFEPVTSGL